MSNFDAALPPPYSGNWKQAERASPEDSPRLTSYEAPGGKPIQFVQKKFEFSGGQSVDTAEYPFGGLWSNETLNEKPQELHIEGFIRGVEYIQTRNALIEALRVKTDDSEPGYIDFPFWGRFPIVVIDYKIAEDTEEKGQCSITLVFRRAGVSIPERVSSISGINIAGVSFAEPASPLSGMGIAGVSSGEQAGSFFGGALETAVEDLETVAIDSFEQAIAYNADASTASILTQGFAQIKSELTGLLGRIQAAQKALNAISAKINAISSHIAQVIRTPGQLARSFSLSLFGVIASVIAGLEEIKNSVASYLPPKDSPVKSSNSAAIVADSAGALTGNTNNNAAGSAGITNNNAAGSAGIANSAASFLPAAVAFSKSSYPAPVPNNERHVLLQFLSASTFALSSVPLTVRQEAAQKAIENLYRISAFAAAGILLSRLDVSFQKTEGYWKLFLKLEASIDKSDPAVYAALETVRIYVSRILSAKELSAERKRYFNTPLPLLSLAQYIGCGEEKLRDLNCIADSFVVKGGVLYV